jgi:serine/threonine protein kinase
LPDIGLEEEFAEKSVHEITQWIWKAYVDMHTNGTVVRSGSVKAEVHTLVGEDDCLECVVLANKIIRNIPGSKLTTKDTTRLHNSCVRFVKSVGDYCHSQETIGLDIGSWKILTHKIWGCYIVRMHVVKGDVAIASLRGIHAVYDAHLGIMSSAVSIGGLISFGGHKLALAGTHTTATQQKDVVLYRSRNDVCEKAKISFREEMRMMQSLRSWPSVLKLNHINEEKSWALVERCTGSVYRLFASLGLTKRRERVVMLLRGCATALIEIHKARVIHRDVKSANFLCKQGSGANEGTYEVKIADFGLAVALPPNIDTTTGDVGTKSYKAPEIKPSAPYGRAVDVYAFGVMVWEMVYDQRRSSQLIKAVSEYDKQHPDSPYKSPTAYAAVFCTPPLTGDYGTNIDDIIRICTSKSPEKRPRMVEVLQRLMHTVVDIPRLVPKRTTPPLAFASALSET